MSAAEFSGILQKAIKRTHSKEIEVFKKNKEEFSAWLNSKEQDTPHDLYINVLDLANLATALKEEVSKLVVLGRVSSEDITKYSSNFISNSWINDPSVIDSKFRESFSTKKDSIVIKNIKFAVINNVYKDKVLDMLFSPKMDNLKSIKLDTGETLYNYLVSAIDRGHRYGQFNKKIDMIAKYMRKAKSPSGEEFFNNMLRLLEKLDSASSNQNSGMTVEATKANKVNYNSLSVEFQFTSPNARSGSQISALGTQINKLFGFTTNKSTRYLELTDAKVQGYLNSMVDTLDKLVKANKTSSAGWENFKGSKSFKEDAIDTVLNKINPEKFKKPKSSKTKIAQKVDVGTIDKASVKVAKAKIKAALEASKKKAKLPTLRNRAGQFTSLVSIQAILERRLLEVLKKNMHSPQLNWRTGRFAESVKVTGLTRTRSDSINIFYTYMNNPYYVFEPGSGSKLATVNRDPKFLIDMSIREIATELLKSKITTTRQ